MLTVLNRHTPYFSRMANVGVGQLHWAASRSSSYDALCSEAAAESNHQVLQTERAGYHGGGRQAAVARQEEAGGAELASEVPDALKGLVGMRISEPVEGDQQLEASVIGVSGDGQAMLQLRYDDGDRVELRSLRHVVACLVGSPPDGVRALLAAPPAAPPSASPPVAAPSAPTPRQQSSGRWLTFALLKHLLIDKFRRLLQRQSLVSLARRQQRRDEARGVRRFGLEGCSLPLFGEAEPESEVASVSPPACSTETGGQAGGSSAMDALLGAASLVEAGAGSAASGEASAAAGGAAGEAHAGDDAEEAEMEPVPPTPRRRLGIRGAPVSTHAAALSLSSPHPLLPRLQAQLRSTQWLARSRTM